MTSGARTAPGSARAGGRSLAQLYCLLAGLTLLAAGILGFIADSSFDTGDGIQGDKLIVFEVNGWHNLVHIASGLVLLAAANQSKAARATALAFGLVYGLVTLIGLIDGEDVLGLIPVNPADNILHLLLSAAGIAAGLLSRPDRSDRAVTNPTATR